MGFDLDNEELIVTRKQLKTYINNNYVNKEKIKNEIKELEEMKVGGEVFITAVNFAKKELQKLLED